MCIREKAIITNIINGNSNICAPCENDMKTETAKKLFQLKSITPIKFQRTGNKYCIKRTSTIIINHFKLIITFFPSFSLPFFVYLSLCFAVLFQIVMRLDEKSYHSHSNDVIRIRFLFSIVPIRNINVRTMTMNLLLAHWT